MHLLGNFNFLATHIYREGNRYTNKLTNLGLDITNFTWWNVVHLVVKLNFHINMLGLPNFRIK